MSWSWRRSPKCPPVRSFGGTDIGGSNLVRFSMSLRDDRNWTTKTFYAKTLHVVTATERLNIPRGAQSGIHLDTRSRQARGWAKWRLVCPIKSRPFGASCHVWPPVVITELLAS